MYSYEDRIKAVKLYIQYGLRSSPVLRELGYPENRHTIHKWYLEYMEHGDLKRTRVCSRPKYTPAQRKTAVEYYLTHGKNIALTIRQLGYPGKTVLSQWVHEDLPPEEVLYCKPSIPRVKLSIEEKEQAAIDLCTRTGSAQEIADKYQVSRWSVYNCKWQMFGKGNEDSMPKQNISPEKSTDDITAELRAEVEQLRKEKESLEREVFKLQLEKDVLGKAAEILKKEQGVSLETLTNKEKAIVIDALRPKYKLKELLAAVNMAKSSYCYQAKAIRAKDKYADIRVKISSIFKASYQCYGYRRIHRSLRNCSIIISEKVIRRLMAEEGLIVPFVKMKKYSSYEGEISPEVPNIINRDFHASKPNEKWLTDITEFGIPAGKVYLSPVIDCFDGLPVSWTIGTSPNADLVNNMLDEAIATLQNDEKPIVHSDRGCHYRWPGWIKRMDDAGLTRSMSKKGCSPDNSACEGFFGRLKNEMFYKRSWQGYTIEQFIRAVDNYIHWYAEERIKLSLGGLSPVQYRMSLGIY